MKIENRSRILVTGGDGFIGSHLVEFLVKKGCRVRALVCYNSLNSWGWLEDLDKEVLSSVEVKSGDVRDRGSVRSMMQDVDFVFHLAALIGIPYSYESPESYVNTNIIGTLNILEEARMSGGVPVLCTSTSEVYGTACYVPINEEHPLQAQSPYSATKIAADRLAQSFFCSFEMPVTIVRPFNTYGPRQSARAIIPTIITQLLSGNEKIMMGSVRPTRDLVFVCDTVEGFCRIAEVDDAIGEEINIATGKEVSIGNLAQELIAQINPNARMVTDETRIRPRNSEVERLLGANDKLKKITGWTPSIALKEGLTKTIEWFRQPGRLTCYKPEIYNV